MSILKVWQLTLKGLATDSRPPGGRLYNKKGILTLFWWENMISDLSSDWNGQKPGG